MTAWTSTPLLQILPHSDSVARMSHDGARTSSFYSHFVCCFRVALFEQSPYVLPRTRHGLAPLMKPHYDLVYFFSGQVILN